MNRTYRFTATVTDLDTGKTEEVSDTATFNQSIVTRHEAEVAIGREFASQRKSARNIRITD
ncbi:hypothetical protein A6P39_015490 [Streptomyces sp. FXJ1.172]|uniref:hypothetical protein n=1 Tax=Streptomyces sp. FXJ1.172 TaxID=710705 RepID=UPI0007CF00C1|nr:hypothetical protein [Streptomyces sp. FXJ1.172]WEO95315.1 hypothetical protein A6P39_015490 [Streptomyces sp. FXJ1.172]